MKALTSGSLAGTGGLNLTPARTIVGSNTGLSEPFGVVFGPDGRLCVASSASDSVAAYASEDLAGTDLNLTLARTPLLARTPGSHCRLVLVVRPDGTLYVSNDGSQSVAVFDRLAVEAFSAAPDSVTFSDQLVNTTSDGSTVTVTNNGRADLAFGAGALTLTGGDPSQFAVDADDCSNQTLTTGDTCTVDVTFTPTSAGVKTQKLVH